MLLQHYSEVKPIKARPWPTSFKRPVRTQTHTHTHRWMDEQISRAGDWVSKAISLTPAMFIMHVAFSSPPTVMLWKDMSVFLSLGGWLIKTSFLCAVGWDPLYLCFTELNICNGISREREEERIRIIKRTHAVLAWRNALRRRHTCAQEENLSNVIWSVEWGECMCFIYMCDTEACSYVQIILFMKVHIDLDAIMIKGFWLFSSGCEKHGVFLTRYHVQKYASELLSSVSGNYKAWNILYWRKKVLKPFLLRNC